MKRVIDIIIIPPLLIFVGVLCFIEVLGIWKLMIKSGYNYYNVNRHYKEDDEKIRYGHLNALNTVEIGSQVNGKIVKIYVDYNDEVKVNQLIAELDDSSFKAQVLRAKARLESEKASQLGIFAKLKQLKSSMVIAKANIESKEAIVKKSKRKFVDSERNYERKKELYSKKLISESELESAKTACDIAKVKLNVSKANLKKSIVKIDAINNQIEAQNADLKKQKARISQREAQLSLAQINLDRTKIYSPINGRIISRDVEVGQTLVSDYETPKLFTIAQNLSQMKLDVSVEESDIGKIKENQEISFTVYAYKDKTFNGTIQKIKISSNSNSKSVNYSAMVKVDNKELLLLPGMTAKAKIF